MKILQQITVPQETVNDEYVTITKLYYNTGDKVKKGSLVIDIETSKAVLSIESETDGFIEYLCSEGKDICIGTVIVKIYDTSTFTQADNISAKPESAKTIPPLETMFSKSALALINTNKIDKSVFSGMDFVNIDDVKNFLNPTEPIEKKQTDPYPETKVSSKKSQPTIDPKKTKIQKLSKSKRTEISYLTDVQSANLTSSVNVFVNIEQTFDFVNNYFSVFENSILPLAVYETSRLLKKYPQLNAFYHDDNIVFYKEIHIGLAVDIDDGLKVLTLPNANTKNLKEIEQDMLNNISKYLDKKLTVKELTGSTFSITDLSVENVGFFSPLINKNQSAILGISAVDEKLQRSILTLTFDHRILEGKLAAAFLNELKERIESYKPSSEDKIKQKSDKIEHIRCSVCYRDYKEDKNLNGLGFVKIIDHDGIEKYICTLCLIHA